MLAYSLYRHAYDEERGRWRRVYVLNVFLVLLVLYMAFFIWTEVPHVQGRVMNYIQNRRSIAPMFNLQRMDCTHPVFGARCDALPNFFLHSSTVSNTPAVTYSHAVLTFLHAPKAGGTTMKNCMEQIAGDMGKQIPYLLHLNSRFEAEVSLSDDSTWLHTAGDMYMGADAWGFCRLVVKRKCAYFMMFREPYDRLVSLYFECRKQNNPPGTGRGNCANSKITDWVMNLKPVLSWMQLHRQLFCKNEDADSCKFFAARQTLEKLGTNNTYVELVAASLERNFAVIGLTEDFNTTFKLLQKAFHLPFYKTCKTMWSNRAVVFDGDLRGYDSIEELKRHTKQELLKDENIAKFIYPDVKLYEKAKDIFAKEKMALETFS